MATKDCDEVQGWTTHALTWDQARRDISSTEQRRGWKENEECDNTVDEVRKSGGEYQNAVLREPFFTHPTRA